MDHPDDEKPPFALCEHSPQHLMFVGTQSRQDTPASTLVRTSPKNVRLCDSHMSTSSSPPGLAESVITDGSSSVPSACDPNLIDQAFGIASSTFLFSSLPTVSSSLGGSSHLPKSRLFGMKNEMEDRKPTPVGGFRGSAGFSQLLRAAEDGNNLHLGHSRMPMVPEDKIVGSESTSHYGGTLITGPSINGNQSRQIPNAHTTWFPYFGHRMARENLRQHLFSSSSNLNMPLLSSSPSAESMVTAKSTVRTMIENDTSFEVSMDLDAPCSVQSVMAVIGNPELLKMWCDPIETLIVTSSSDALRESSMERQADQAREYEGEWIEATTTALESPPSNVGYIYSAGQTVLDTLGCTSYGKITMFVERRRGQVGLTVGPFNGGIHAAHTISVFEDGNRVRIVDRVRLSQDEEQPSILSMFFCGMLDSCLSSCLLPSIKGYMEQVTTSMARLRLLVENGDLSHEAVIIRAQR